MNDAILLPISEPSQAGEARRRAVAIAERLGFDETERGKVGLVVTEMANNLVRHAQEGLLLLQVLEQNRQVGIEILALDKGPGMRNVSECLQDGYSTAGTAGTGLGAIHRLATVFDIHSVVDVGTAILVQLWSSSFPVIRPPSIRVSGICLPKVGEEISGDTWVTAQSTHRTLLMVADGLGHGSSAAQASAEAVRVFREQAHRSPKEIVEATHAALRNTRGAALAIAAIDLEQRSIRFAGIGNIAGAVHSTENRYSMVSYNGTVGHEVRKIQEFTYAWPERGLLVMHSDGLGTQWQLDRYVGLAAKHPSLIAGVLYRDFHRDRDDVTVLIAKEEAEL